ncbi:MAG: hypothetical protein ACJ72K_02680 [Friedmanniella sp.]
MPAPLELAEADGDEVPEAGPAAAVDVCVSPGVGLEGAGVAPGTPQAAAASTRPVSARATPPWG